MGLISRVVVGGIAGLLTKRVAPDRSTITRILGIAGACLGGFVFGVLRHSGAASFDVWSVAALGAVFLLCLFGLFARLTG